MLGYKWTERVLKWRGGRLGQMKALMPRHNMVGDLTGMGNYSVYVGTGRLTGGRNGRQSYPPGCMNAHRVGGCGI